MPIEVYTGKPGNGKTAFAMERLTAEAAKAERPIVAAGIDGLRPGLATELADIRRWNDIDPHGDPVCDCPEPGDPDRKPRELHAHVLPNGALCFVDEAWKWFGHLHDASRQSTPLHVLSLAEHRHRGIDFIWTTQGPNQLYPFARPLIADHYHCVRRFGTQIIDVYKWEELQEDVKSASKRENAQRTTRSLPKAVFGSYKSADAHTIKAKIPLKVYALPVMILAGAGLIWLAIELLKPSAQASEVAEQGQAAGLPAAGPGSLTRAGNADGPRYETIADYVEAHAARIPTLPWSAPVYDDRDVVADPQIWCMASGAGRGASGEWLDASVFCLTEQGTVYKLPEKQARYFARWGSPYNPYKEAPEQHSGQLDREAEPPSASPATAVLTAPQATGYGDIGINPNPGTALGG